MTATIAKAHHCFVKLVINSKMSTETVEAVFIGLLFLFCGMATMQSALLCHA